MSDHDDEPALLKEIAANPKEDTLRLAYADWLDEHSEHSKYPTRTPQRMRDQSELIRLRIRLRREPSSRTAEDNDRENELRQSVIDGLGPEIAHILWDNPNRVTFDGGIIRELDLSRTTITALPEGLMLISGLHLAHTPLTSLPSNIHADHLGLSHTQITTLPDGLRVGGSLDLSSTPISSLPDDLEVGGNFYISNTGLSAEAIRRIPEMDGLSDSAKITGLQSVGYATLADQVERAVAVRSGSSNLPSY